MMYVVYSMVGMQGVAAPHLLVCSEPLLRDSCALYISCMLHQYVNTLHHLIEVTPASCCTAGLPLTQAHY
jgi:hypothetical protein